MTALHYACLNEATDPKEPLVNRNSEEENAMIYLQQLVPREIQMQTVQSSDKQPEFGYVLVLNWYHMDGVQKNE